MQPPLKDRRPAAQRNTIFLLRHGEVEGTTGEKRFVGQTDLPLSGRGRRQAQFWRQWLTGIPISAVISSDLCRCMETARILTADSAVEITPATELREIHLGQWEGMFFRQVMQRWPDRFRQRGMAPAHVCPPDGESFMDLRRRVLPLFEKMVDQHHGNLLIVAHAGVNRVILCHVLNLAAEHLFRIAQDCGAMNRIDRCSAGYRLQWLNLPAHAIDRCPNVP